MAREHRSANNPAFPCPRCRGRMHFQKFYSLSSSFFGWRCVNCGDIVDPVILLHRITRNSGIQIPENKREVFALLKKSMAEQQAMIPERGDRGGNGRNALRRL